MQRNGKLLYLTQASVIAALYVTLSVFSGLFGLASGAIQVRISEALCVLPVFFSSAVPGLTAGCLIYNLLFSANVFDIIFGTLATLIGAALSRLFVKRKYLAFIPSFVSNTLIIPFVIAFSFTDGGFAAVPLLILTVGAGELISTGLLGNLLVYTISKYGKKLL